LAQKPDIPLTSGDAIAAIVSVSRVPPRLFHEIPTPRIANMATWTTSNIRDEIQRRF
jgi:hypothetical protein